MQEASLIPAEAYKYIYYIVVGLIGLIYYSGITRASANNLIERPAKSRTFITVFTIVIILFIGLRPISAVFSDMMGYASMFNSSHIVDTAKNEEGLWWIADACKSFGFGVNIWFLAVCTLYYGLTLRACKLLSPNNWDHLFLTFLLAFSTLAYATNGIRNGLALASLTFGLALFITKKKRARLFSIVFFAFAFATHKSSVLPLICFFAAYYLVNFKRALLVWILAIVLSLTIGESISDFFFGFGFDERLEGYLNDTNYEGFSHAGFRWDFLLYSIMPIILGYYIVIKKGVRNRIYEILLSTYVLANAFWVMVIRAQFSDRFAYLSWFLYAIVIAYPLFSTNIWGNKQGRIAKRILYIHLAFTLFMNLIYYTLIKTVL